MRLSCSFPPGSQRQPPRPATRARGLSLAGGEPFLLSNAQQFLNKARQRPEDHGVRELEVGNNNTNLIIGKTKYARFGITGGVIPPVVGPKCSQVRPVVVPSALDNQAAKWSP